MTIPCVLHQQLLPAGEVAVVGLRSGGGRALSSSSSITNTRICVRALKKSQSTSTSGRERTSSSGRSSSTSSRDRSSSRKGSVAEKSLAAQSRGKGATQVSKRKGDSSTLEVDSSLVATLPGKGATQVSKRKGGSSTLEVDSSRVATLPGPKPPAGFILDEEGTVVLVAPASNRIVTIRDPATERPLECMIRRAFQSSDGQNCLLLLPLDMPLQILKIDEESEGVMELSDEELQEVLPSAVYALAKRRLHLIVSGFCLTARGGFCYTEEHVLDFKAEYGEGLGGSLTEGVEIANFQLKHTEYIVYTPFDPVMFVARRDENTGQLTIADDDLLDDDIVLNAIEEENEFQTLVEEEDAMHEALREAK